MSSGEPKSRTGAKELAWFVMLWVAGVCAVSALAFIIRLFIG